MSAAASAPMLVIRLTTGTRSGYAPAIGTITSTSSIVVEAVTARILLPTPAALPSLAATAANDREVALARRLLWPRPHKENAMTTESTKLSRHTIWLFAFGSIATGIAAS